MFIHKLVLLYVIDTKIVLPQKFSKLIYQAYNAILIVFNCCSSITDITYLLRTCVRVSRYKHLYIIYYLCVHTSAGHRLFTSQHTVATL